MSRFQLSSARECQYQRWRGGDWQRGPQTFEQRYAPYGKPQRCRDCGKKLDDGELVIEWLADADHLYWRMRKFIHAEPCSERHVCDGGHDWPCNGLPLHEMTTYTGSDMETRRPVKLFYCDTCWPEYKDI